MRRTELVSAARQLARLLKRRELKIVFAESCTGGLISGVLAEIPGISNHLCGSAVVYRIETKSEWLKVPRPLLDKPGPVSRTVAERMALGVLQKTPEADLAVSVTGHLGPDAPRRLDGVMFVGIASRRPAILGARGDCIVKRHLLQAGGEQGRLSPVRLRRQRQIEAAHFAISAVQQLLATRW